MNASIYAYKPEYLRSAQESGKGVLDGYCEMVKTYDITVFNLDHENDFELMEVIAEHLSTSKDKFKSVFDNAPAKEPDLLADMLDLTHFLTATIITMQFMFSAKKTRNDQKVLFGFLDFWQSAIG